MNKPFGVCLQPVLLSFRYWRVIEEKDDEEEVISDIGRLRGNFGVKKKRSVANGGLKSASAYTSFADR